MMSIPTEWKTNNKRRSTTPKKKRNKINGKSNRNNESHDDQPNWKGPKEKTNRHEKEVFGPGPADEIYSTIRWEYTAGVRLFYAFEVLCSSSMAMATV